MGQRVAVVINDGATTPVATTFNPEVRADGTIDFVDRLPGVPVGFRRLVTSSQMPSGQSQMYRSKFNVVCPALKTVDGVQVLSHVCRMNVEAVYPNISTPAQRNDTFAFTYNGLNNALIKAHMRDLDFIF